MRIKIITLGALVILTSGLLLYKKSPSPSIDDTSSSSQKVKWDTSIPHTATPSSFQPTLSQTEERPLQSTAPLASTTRPSAFSSRKIPSHRSVAAVIRNLEAPLDNWREFNPETLVLRLFGETDVPFTRVSHTTNPKHSIWVGRNQETSGWIVAVSNEQSWNAEINFPGGNSYRVISGQKTVVSEAAPIALQCPSSEHLPARSAAADMPTLLQATPPAALTDTDLSNVNISTVAVLYDEDTENYSLQIMAEAQVEGTAEEFIEANILASLELANYYLLVSEVDNLEWELAGIAKIPAYNINNDLSMGPDLDAISLTTTSAGIFARQFLTEMKADQGVLVVGGERDYDGLGETPGNHSVVAWYHYEYLSALLAHELGHNFGCNHDRATEEAPDNNGLYAYGHNLTAAGESLGTIMSYGGEYWLSYFSNPDVSYEGVPTGVPDDQPKAANNARQLRENAALIANFRKHDDDPTITQHPQGRNVAPGESLSLTVAATGPNLRYQWYKGATDPIAEATSTTLELDSVTTDDSGSYFVTVTNNRGTATSNLAHVNVRIPTSSSGGGSSGGGGGGGGAPSLWFLLSLTVLLGARRLHQQHTNDG